MPLRYVCETSMKQLHRHLRTFTSYSSVYDASISQRKEFWAEKAEELVWERKWDRIFDESDLIYPKWFDGGLINTTYNCVDRHVDSGFGDQLAIIYDSPITNTKRTMTYQELLDKTTPGESRQVGYDLDGTTKVSRFAGVLSKYGVQKGDRVVIYMPMIPETMIVMLACARIGAPHVLVFGGFSSKELGTRVKHATPKIIVAANCGVEPGSVVDYYRILNDAIKFAGYEPNKCVIYNRHDFPPAKMKPSRDVDFEEELEGSNGHDPVPVEANDPAYILYTSGTTSLPKGVVRPTGGHAVVLNWSMKNIYDVDPGEVWWSASDFGWVVGHSYICYAPLFNRNTTVIYEGKPVGTPDPGQYFRVLEEHNVVSLFCAPTALRAIRRDDPNVIHGSAYKFPNFRALFMAGEHCDPATLEWSKSVFNAPIIDHCWQTETGWPITAMCRGIGDREQPPPQVAGRAVPGYDICIMPREGPSGPEHEVERGTLGRILVKLPLPPGCMTTLWQNKDKFEDVYFKQFPGFYDTMDAGYVTKDGFVAVMSRDDDVINVAGHRLSAGALEEAVLLNPDLAECAVIGLHDTLKGQIPFGLLCIRADVTKDQEQILSETYRLVRENIGPVAAFRKAIIVPKLPKTRSGKIPRNTLAAMAAGKPYKVPVTIEDPNVYSAIGKAMTKFGLNPSEPSA